MNRREGSLLVEFVAMLPVILVFITAITSMFYVSASLIRISDDMLQLELAREEIIYRFDVGISGDIVPVRANSCVIDFIRQTSDGHEIHVSKNSFNKKLKTTVIIPKK